jgi:hypothetical protein
MWKKLLLPVNGSSDFVLLAEAERSFHPSVMMSDVAGR